MTAPIAVQACGMVSAIGLSAAASCAAIRCALDNFRETRFMDQGGEWIQGAEVELEQPWRGLPKLIRMAARAIDDCLDGQTLNIQTVPVILCVAEKSRQGRLEMLEANLMAGLQNHLGIRFHADSEVIVQGRVSGALALARAQEMIYQHAYSHCLVVGVDSLLSASTLKGYEASNRLLTSQYSNGFIPGEGASAVLLARPTPNPKQLVCLGMGTGREDAPIGSDQPLRANGLFQAIKAAQKASGLNIADMDFRIADVNGEQYYFKEASLAYTRTIRTLKEEFDIWHPADCIGEIGAAAVPSMLAVLKAACEKDYSLGNRIMVQSGSDDGQRSVMFFQYGEQS